MAGSSDTESAEAADGAKDEKDAEEGKDNKEKVDEEAAINNNNTKKSVTARFTITHVCRIFILTLVCSGSRAC